MNQENYHMKSKAELQAMLKEVRAELGRVKFLKGDQSNSLSPAEIKKLKKEVARILTAYNKAN